mmetsp:Transcript_41718/g.62256  ORF Transcript_41718/g.62256 Transcript_41718/m.62256 type:complete len:163 (+) Transcript_41718:1-489(+)
MERRDKLLRLPESNRLLPMVAGIGSAIKLAMERLSECDPSVCPKALKMTVRELRKQGEAAVQRCSLLQPGTSSGDGRADCHTGKGARPKGGEVPVGAKKKWNRLVNPPVSGAKAPGKDPGRQSVGMSMCPICKVWCSTDRLPRHTERLHPNTAGDPLLGVYH